MKVFLGGTTNNSNWRDKFIPLLEIDYFNPVVSDWTLGDYHEELKQRDVCDFVLYCLTPKMSGCYSVAELTEDSCKNPTKTIFVLLSIDEGQIFTESETKSLIAVAKLVKRNGAVCFSSLQNAANYINEQANTLKW